MRFIEAEPETELFEDVELSGSRTANGELTVTITVTQAYPVAVRVACFYELADKDLTDDEKQLAFAERASKIGETLLPPSPETKPDDEVEPVEVTFRFSVAEPGRYFLACLTPAAPDNGIGMIFRIRRS